MSQQITINEQLMNSGFELIKSYQHDEFIAFVFKSQKSNFYVELTYKESKLVAAEMRCEDWTQINPETIPMLVDFVKVNYFEPTERARKNPRNINALMFIYERVKPNWGYPIDPVKKLLSTYLMKDLIDDLNEAGHRAPRGGEFTSMQVYRLLDRLHWVADFYENNNTTSKQITPTHEPTNHNQRGTAKGRF